MPEPAPIREYADVDRHAFEARIVPPGQPAVLRGLVREWPCVAAARRSDDALAAYLRRHATDVVAETWVGEPAIGGRFGYSDGFDGYNHERKLATVDQILDLLLCQRGAAEPWSIYAGALPLARHLPRLRDDNPMPLLDAEREMLVSLWLGNRTKTAAHWDLPQNLACVVAGRRRFTLFPPEQVGNLYVGPLDFTLAGQPSSLVDVSAPDLERFPRAADALAAAQVAELGAGDALYVPSLWWHAVQGLDEVGAMVNFWWRDGPGWTTTPLMALFHAILLVRPLPANERAAWKAMFDHYAFEPAPFEHVPEQARGVLGDRAPDAIAAMKARLARSLAS